jgi:RHS repeat-associated protein
VLTEDGSSWTQETLHEYDAAGRKTKDRLKDGGSYLDTSYVYEAHSGRLSRTERANSTDERYTYDELGRITGLKVTASGSSTVIGGDTYTYDARDRITQRERVEGASTIATQYAYDAAGQLIRETSEHGIVRSYRYGDANSSSFGTDLQRESLHIDTALSGASLTLTRYAQIHECATTPTCTGADAAQITSALNAYLEPGVSVDPAIQTGVTLEVAKYLHTDLAAEWQTTAPAPVGACVHPAGDHDETFVITASSGTTGATEPTWPTSGSVTQDAVTYLRAACERTLTIRQHTYTTGSPAKHQLTQTTDQRGAQTHYAYDSLGNQIYSGSTAYTGTANQEFDLLGRATKLQSGVGAGIVEMEWYHDKMQLAQWKHGGTTRTLKYDSDGRITRITASGTQNWTSDYHYDETGLAAFTTSANKYYLDRNTRGDIIAIRNASGTLQATIRYTAYGEAWTDNQTLVDKLAHTYNGRDGVISLGGGLYWMTVRTYSATSGRFFSPDPLEPEQSFPNSTYGYAGNDPVNITDPLGLSTSCGNCVQLTGDKKAKTCLLQLKGRTAGVTTPYGSGRIWCSYTDAKTNQADKGCLCRVSIHYSIQISYTFTFQRYQLITGMLPTRKVSAQRSLTVKTYHISDPWYKSSWVTRYAPSSCGGKRKTLHTIFLSATIRGTRRVYHNDKEVLAEGYRGYSPRSLRIGGGTYC